ncbi:MAG: hypothetical protein HKN20_10330, partial [Gemmatimonadetes bacterium]|nr:hypothetical protein [Gemmatimonadota bacterium]
PMLPQFPIHALVGAALACDEDIDAAWCRAMGFDDREPASAIMIDKDQIERALDFDDDRLNLDFTLLPEGADFAVAYAAYLMFPAEMRAGAPKVFQHMYKLCGQKAGGRGRRDSNAGLKGELRI